MKSKRCVMICCLASAVVCVLTGSGHTCSTFYIAHREQPVFGKNYDWSVDVGFLVVNKRGVSKVALADRAPATWTSKYGSVTFNQYGRELPSGGMNEVGLVVELMWLEATEYSKPDSRPALGNLQWIQYQLDNSAAVADVVASDPKIRVEPAGEAKIHYLIADREGNSATIEFIDGKLAYHTGDRLPWSVLTNDTYASSLQYLSGFEGFGGSRRVSPSTTSLGRFVNAANMVARFDSGGETSCVDYAFDILDSVAQGDYTKWSIVYDIEGATIHFRTFTGRKNRYVRVADCEFDCATPVSILDINANLSGDVTEKFVPYTYKLNRSVIEGAFRGTSFLQGVSSETLNFLAQYPSRMICEGAAQSR